MKYSLILAIALLSLASKCDKNIEDMRVLSYNETATMEVGEEVATAGTPVDGFKFVGVTAESRCPKGVNCIRAGEVKFEIMTSDGATLETQFPAANMREKAGFRLPNGDFIEVTDVQPYPENGTRIPLESYKVQLVLRPASQGNR